MRLRYRRRGRDCINAHHLCVHTRFVLPSRPVDSIYHESPAQVLPCNKRFCHDWTVCPFAHAGEKAKRRDPCDAVYTGIACVDMKKVCGNAGTISYPLCSPSRRRTAPVFAATIAPMPTTSLSIGSTQPATAPNSATMAPTAAGASASSPTPSTSCACPPPSRTSLLRCSPQPPPPQLLASWWTVVEYLLRSVQEGSDGYGFRVAVFVALLVMTMCRCLHVTRMHTQEMHTHEMHTAYAVCNACDAAGPSAPWPPTRPPPGGAVPDPLCCGAFRPNPRPSWAPGCAAGIHGLDQQQPKSGTLH